MQQRPAVSLPLTFTSSNWNKAQTITVYGEDDLIRDGLVNSEVKVAINKQDTLDSKYAVLSSQSLSVSTIDDGAVPLVSLAASASSLNEGGGQVILTVTQNVASLSDTTVTLGTSGNAVLNSDYSLSSTSLTIPAGSREATITLTAVSDWIDEDAEEIKISIGEVSGAAVGTDQLAAITINDDDTSAFVIVETDGGTTVSESGAKDPQVLLSNSKQAGNFEGETAFNSLLKQQSIPFYVQYENPNRASTHRKIIYKRLTPINNLNMWDLFTNNWFDGGKGYQNNFNTDFKLFSNLDDAIADKNQWSFCNFNDQGIGFPRDCGPNGYVAGQWLSFKRASRGYGWENWSFSLMNQSGGGSQDTFTVVLGSEPTSNVVVDLTASDSTEAVVSKSSLTFNASNWNQAQTVTVSGVDDPIRDELVNRVRSSGSYQQKCTSDTKYAALSR